MFAITDRKGFHMRFENGYTVSVQFGRVNYCDNRMINFSGDAVSSNAEVAVWDRDGNYVTSQFTTEGDPGVAGWQTPEQVAQIIYAVSTRSPHPCVEFVS